MSISLFRSCLLKSVEIVGEMTDKCQCFPLNFQKNSWLFHSRDNIDPCYKHFCLPFPQSVEWKLFQFWRGNAIHGMETLSRVKINFSKKRGLFQDFEFWKFAFSSFLPFVYFASPNLWKYFSNSPESTRVFLSNEIMNRRASHSTAIEGNNNWKRSGQI